MTNMTNMPNTIYATTDKYGPRWCTTKMDGFAEYVRKEDGMTKELVERARGRSRFCRDRGEVKSPQIIDQLADALEAVTQERDRMREALEWYAEQVEGCNRYGNGGDVCRNRLAKDLGSRARAALSGEAQLTQTTRVKDSSCPQS